MTRRYAEELLGPLAMLAFGIASVIAAPSTARAIVTAALFVVAELGLLGWRLAHDRPPLAPAFVLLTFVAGLAAMGVAPSGFGEVPVLVAATRLPLTLPDGRRTPALIAGSVAFGVDVYVISGNLVGLLAGIGVWLLGQRTLATAQLEVERDRAVALLAEVEAARDAQARAAATAERVRIARDLHDVLAHSLAALSLRLQAIRTIATQHELDAEITGPLDDAAALARDGVTEARRAVSALQDTSSPGLDQLPDMVARFPGAARLRVAGSGDVTPEAGHAVYRAVQEALTNAARYAPGAPVHVDLDWQPTRLLATVVNEAPAHPAVPDPAASGQGLRGMAERLAGVGGSGSAGPGGGGWVVRLEVPR